MPRMLRVVEIDQLNGYHRELYLNPELIEAVKQDGENTLAYMASGSIHKVLEELNKFLSVLKD